MKTAAQYLDAIRDRHGLNSDRKAALALGLSQTAIARFRSGAETFSDETAVKVAELLELEAAEVMIAAHAQRSRDPRTRALWEDLAKKAGYAAGIALLAGSMAAVPAPARAAAAACSSALGIMSTRRRSGFRPATGRRLRGASQQAGIPRLFFRP